MNNVTRNDSLLMASFPISRMMWAAGAVAAMSSITFPAVSALISRTAEPDQQGWFSREYMMLQMQGYSLRLTVKLLFCRCGSGYGYGNPWAV